MVWVEDVYFGSHKSVTQRETVVGEIPWETPIYTTLAWTKNLGATVLTAQLMESGSQYRIQNYFEKSFVTRTRTEIKLKLWSEAKV